MPLVYEIMQNQIWKNKESFAITLLMDCYYITYGNERLESILNLVLS